MNMNSANIDVVSFMDILDLDEEHVDSRLKTIMERQSYTNKNLINALQLLKYKHLINLQENTDCDNSDEFNFIARLINIVDVDTVATICKIINVVLNLNSSEIVSKSEHLVQQILCDMDLAKLNADNIDDDRVLRVLLNFKLCESILDTLIDNQERVSLLFLEINLEEVLTLTDDNLRVHFLTNTVPKFIEGTSGYDILARIWLYILKLDGDAKENALKTLCCLCEYYLPVVNDDKCVKFESEIVYQLEFWQLLLYGLNSYDPSTRKVSIYLIKRAIDSIITHKNEVYIKTEHEIIFTWKSKNEMKIKEMWDNFFILLDSLEEKQSNIVLPSLHLFDSLSNIESCWLNCIFKLGLNHDNTQIKLKCIDYRLKVPLESETEASTLLEALNDVNIYDNFNECELLKKASIFYNSSITYIFKAICKVKWSPVPLYYISNVFASLETELEYDKLVQNIYDLLKIPCNNIAVRRALHVNIFHFVGNNFKHMHWKQMINIISKFNVATVSIKKNSFMKRIENLNVDEKEKVDFLNYIAESRFNINFALYYLKYHEGDLITFLNIVKEKVKVVQDIVNRQYANKAECLSEVLFLLQLYSTAEKTDVSFKETIKIFISREYKIILQYLTSLLTSDIGIDMEEFGLLFKEFNIMSAVLNDTNVTEIILHLYKISVIILKDKHTTIYNKMLCVHIVTTLHKNFVLLTHCQHEMLTFMDVIQIVREIVFKEDQSSESVGRLKNIFYEKACHTAYDLLEDNNEKLNIRVIIEFIENITNCGGYGCLQWALRILYKVLPMLLQEKQSDYNLAQVLNKMWNEIEELKSNNQYSPCIEVFVDIITQYDLLREPMYNNVVVLYCTKILEYSTVKNTPLYYLVKKLDDKIITLDHGHIIHVLSEIFLYSLVPRKDQRIADNIAVEIIANPKYVLHINEIEIYFNYQIRYISISILSKIVHKEILETICSSIINKIDENLKNKRIYHKNSHTHRLLLTGIQHLLFICLLNLDILMKESLAFWALELLGRLPHQPSVKVCLEWLIALHLYSKNRTINEELLQLLKSKNIPITSQFIIMYWIIKHKIFNNSYLEEEYDFVMETLFSHTMGQMFNIRLQAQYLTTKLNDNHKQRTEKYDFIIEIIHKNFEENNTDKTFLSLKQDLFVNDFDIISNLTPMFVYSVLPRYFDVASNENLDENYINKILNDVDDRLCAMGQSKYFKGEWIKLRKGNSNFKTYELIKNREAEMNKSYIFDPTIVIQKKYIPWKNMADITVYDTGKKMNSQGEMILVASLIDKLPNLGGMARTSEVFGVKTYVIDSLRHLQDKQFQGLSVSAERWVNIEEVRPGPPLKEYLLSKKAEGYSIVAAEQTSSSCALQSFKFPKKTLLLLGHEKEGVPCDLLPMMDKCIEIPQRGLVRSLNVHVTAAIFIWEYTRQNML